MSRRRRGIARRLAGIVAWVALVILAWQELAAPAVVRLLGRSALEHAGFTVERFVVRRVGWGAVDLGEIALSRGPTVLVGAVHCDLRWWEAARGRLRRVALSAPAVEIDLDAIGDDPGEAVGEPADRGADERAAIPRIDRLEVRRGAVLISRGDRRLLFVLSGSGGTGADGRLSIELTGMRGEDVRVGIDPDGHVDADATFGAMAVGGLLDAAAPGVSAGGNARLRIEAGRAFGGGDARARIEFTGDLDGEVAGRSFAARGIEMQADLVPLSTAARFSIETVATVDRVETGGDDVREVRISAAGDAGTIHFDLDCRRHDAGFGRCYGDVTGFGPAGAAAGADEPSNAMPIVEVSVESPWWTPPWGRVDADWATLTATWAGASDGRLRPAAKIDARGLAAGIPRLGLAFAGGAVAGELPLDGARDDEMAWAFDRVELDGEGYGEISGTVAAEESGWSGTIEAVDALSGPVEWAVDRSPAGGWRLCPATSVIAAGDLPARIVARLADGVEIAGAFTIGADGGDGEIAIDLTLRDGRVGIADVAFDGVEGRVRVDRRDGAWSTPPAQPVRAASARIGRFVAEDILATFRMEDRERILVERMHGRWGGGRVSAESFRVRPTVGIPEVVLYCDGIEVAEALRQIAGERVVGTGRLHGRIPMRLQWQPKVAVRVGEGFLFAEPGGGTIGIPEPDVAGQWVEQGLADLSGEMRRQLTEALQNLLYEDLAIRFAPDPRGRPSMLIDMSGHARSRPEVPVRFTIGVNLEPLPADAR